tara:strand:+ start:1105 stop:2406 length:1302 start_codon:yes stop_codon:yes gene_type:complete
MLYRHHKKMNMKTIIQLKTQQRLGGVPPRSERQPDRTSIPQNTVGADAINEQVQQLAQQLANEIIAEQQQAQIIARNGRTFTKFDTVNDIVDNQTETVTAGLWSGNTASLTTYFTSSIETTSQRRYYVDTYNGAPSLTDSAVQFSLAFGHALGSGSDSQGQLNDSPSKAIYSQYRQLLLNPNDSRFTTAGSGSTDYFYAVNFKRNRLKERLDAGNFELPLRFMSASLDTNATGSNVAVSSSVVYSLIDDSSLASATVGDSGRVYNIVSGSINSGVFNPTAPVYYGLAYPDFGTLILDGKMLDQQLNFQTNTGSSSEGNNHFRLFHSVSGSSLLTNPETSDPYGFLARNSEKITSTHYFVRIKNAEYNFSNNPSYVTGSVGELSQTTFVGDPKTYITTVGLYNGSQELLAVAKLSKPLLKSFQREALIRVKLDF